MSLHGAARLVAAGERAPDAVVVVQQWDRARDCIVARPCCRRVVAHSVDPMSLLRGVAAPVRLPQRTCHVGLPRRFDAKTNKLRQVGLLLACIGTGSDICILRTQPRPSLQRLRSSPLLDRQWGVSPNLRATARGSGHAMCNLCRACAT